MPGLTKIPLTNMLELQTRLNNLTFPDWLAANFAWTRAIRVECAEMTEHLGWKWWKRRQAVAGLGDDPQPRLARQQRRHVAADRAVYGSDWPHVGIPERDKMPQVGDLLDLLAHPFGDEVAAGEP